MKTKWTPGTWKTTPTFSHVFVNSGNGNDGVVCKMADKNTVLQWACEGSSLENSANARLIAAAPDLAEALEHAVNWCIGYDEATRCPDDLRPTWLNQAIAALKAAGVEV